MRLAGKRCVTGTRSRPFADVVAEAQSLVDSGAREITLLGQNVNAYEGGLDKLIREIAEISPDLEVASLK